MFDEFEKCGTFDDDEMMTSREMEYHLFDKKGDCYN